MRKRYYIFIFDEYRNYYSAKKASDGSWIVSSSQNPLPIYSLPSNLEEEEIEFATNKQYLSLVRSVSNSFSFVGDGAAILRSLYYQGNGIEQKAYILIMKWSPTVGYHKLEYTGRIDFSKKVDLPKLGTFTVPTVDNTAWGWLSEFDTVQYSVPCNASNPKAIRVLIDGVNLLNNASFQSLNTNLTVWSGESIGTNYYWILPLVLVNQSGDSFNVVLNSQQSQYGVSYSDLIKSPNFFIKYVLGSSNPVSISGKYSASFTAGYYSDTYILSIVTNIGQNVIIKQGKIFDFFLAWNPAESGWLYRSYSGYFTFDINASITLATGEVAYLVMKIGTEDSFITVYPDLTTITVSTKTTSQDQIVYALRPLDLGDAIVQQATNGRYRLYSNFYTTNNKVVVASGDSIRNVYDAAIYSSFADWFKTYFTLDFTVPVIKDGDIWIESFEDVYKAVNSLGYPNIILELGECIDLEFDVANDWYCDEVEVGYQKKDYRHPSGVLSFNTTNTFSLDFLNSKNKLSLVAPYSADCYGITFLIVDYQGNSTNDNPDDKSNWLLDITDDTIYGSVPISNFLPLNIDTAPLAPYIRYPFGGQVLYNNSGNIFPIIRGVSIPNTRVNIFVDGEYNNNVTSDSDGYYSCQIIYYGSVGVNGLTPFVLGVSTGVHVIDAISGDSPTEGDPKNSITITCRNDNAQQLSITSHFSGEEVVDNSPLIYGYGKVGNTIVLTISNSGNYLTQNITVDENGMWFYQCIPNNYLGSGNTNGIVLKNGTNEVNVSDASTGENVLIFLNCDLLSYATIPIPTSIGDLRTRFANSENFIEVNNLPVINGVAPPNTYIYLYASYIQYQILNANGADPVNRPGVKVQSDSNGNWSFKCYTGVTYLPDGTTTTNLTPLPSGLTEITASDINYIGLTTPIPIDYIYLSEPGYKLNRPAYTSITGVLDNTVFNTRITPKHILESHYPRFASILQQTQLPLTFQTSYRNANLTTTLNGVTTSERANITYGELGSPFALMEIAKVTVAVPESFNDIMYSFSQGGLVHCTFNGSDLYLLPIGKMKQASVTANTQVFELLVSSLTSFNTLLLLYKRGITINIMNNTIYHSNANSLHFVKYDFDLPSKYQTPDLYDNLFENRNGFYPQRPKYTQKYNTGDGFQDQLLTYGTPSLYLNVYDAYTGEFKTTIDYVPVSPIPVPPPYVVMEAQVNLSTLGVGAFFFVVSNTSGNGGDNYLISEPIIVADSWDRTILIESFNSTNMTDVYFSTGLRTIIRVEGLVKKYQPDINKTVDRDIAGDTNLLYSLSSKKRTIRFGTAYGLPDYLYLKIADALLLDGLMIEGVGYTLGKDEEISPSEDVESHPMFYYDVNLTPSVNKTGVNVQVDNTINQGTVVINMDATAFGYPAGIESIEIDND